MKPKWMKSVEDIAVDRADVQMSEFFEKELMPTCFKCGKALSEKNASGACREHWSQLPKKKGRKK